MAEPFVWGTSGNKLSPSDRRRRLAEALMMQGSDSSPVGHWAQGLNRVAQALVGAWDMNQADAMDRAGVAALASEPLLAGSSAPAAPTMAGGEGARSMAMPAVTPDMKTGIAEAATALGISPVDLATTISYETGGTFNPTQAGPTTKWGQHRGLIQFGEPQAKQYGVDWNNPAGSQLGANGAIVAYLRDRGVKPGMGLMDIYSTINAGAPGLYDRSDTAAGGAPGTVADKVNNQMGKHRARAQAMFADLPAAGASPVSQETGQPGFTVPPAPQSAALSGMQFNAIHANDIVPPVFQSEGVSQPWMGTVLPRQPAAPAMVAAPLPPSRPTDLAMPQADLPAPSAVPTIGQLPTAGPQEDLSNSPGAGGREQLVQALMQQQGQAAPPAASGVQRVAQAVAAGQSDAATNPAVSQGVQNVAAAAAPQAPAIGGNERLASAMRILNSPYAQPGQRAIAQMVVQQAFRDPAEVEMKRLQLDKARREAENAPLDAEGRRLDIETKRKNLGKPDDPIVRNVKQPDGSEVVLQYDRKSGDWLPLRAPEGGNAVRAPAKLTEQQSKDVGFYNRGSKIVDRLDQQDVALKDTLSALGGNVSNYLKSDAYRQAEQTGRELLAVILRKDTGAAVTDKEMELYGSIYLPKPGDDEATVAQKRASRRTAIEGLKMGLGPAEILFNSANPPPPPSPPAPPAAPAPPQRPGTPDRAALEAEARRRGLIK